MRGFGLSFRLSGGIGSEGVWVVAWRGMGCERGVVGYVLWGLSLCLRLFVLPFSYSFLLFFLRLSISSHY